MLTIYFKSKNLISILQNRAVRLPHQPAYLFLEDGQHETAQITYGELDRKARLIGAYLQKQNLFGQRILLLYPAGLEFITAFMGCLYAGAIAVPIHCPKIAEFEKVGALINTIAEDADIAGVFTTQTYVKKTAECLKESADKIFIADTMNIDSNLLVMYQIPKIRDDTIAYLQYTSGSTSAPKAAVISHKNLTHSLKSTVQVWCYKKSSVTLVWAPHSHVYGLICGLLVPLFHGSLAILMPPEAFIRYPACWLKTITKYQVTHSGCPNFGYEICVREINAAELVGLNLKTWKVAINGGEIAQLGTLEAFSQKFSPCGFDIKYFCSAYGMSELTGAIAASQYGNKPTHFNLATESLKNNKVAFANKKTPSRKFVSSGYLLPGLHAVIVDADTHIPLRAGKIGEVWLSGKSVANGYWRRPEETIKAFQAKLPDSGQMYFRTGDLGFIRKEELCLTGRLKEMIVVYGKKYYPFDLEATVASVLKDFPINNSRAAFSIVNKDKEEVIFLEEVRGEVSAAIQDEMSEIIRREIVSRYGIELAGVILVEANSLPKTSSGKLQRTLCRKQFLENKLKIIKKAMLVEANVLDLTDKLQRHDSERKLKFLKHISLILNLDEKKIDLNAPLSKYHFDSVTLIKVSAALNDIYGLTLTPAILYQYATLNEFFDDISMKVQEGKPKTDAAKIDSQISASSNLPLHADTKDIAIIGMSGIFPGASDLKIFWDNLLLGKDLITEIPKERWDWKEFYGDPSESSKTKVKWGGFIEGIAEFDADFFNISPREAELMDPQQRLFLQTVWKTMEDAGYSQVEFAKLNVGLFVGVFNNDYAELLQKSSNTDAYVATGITHSILANRVSYLLNLRGPSEAIDTACSSSLVAIHHAVQAIRNGDCDIALAGGVNVLLTPTTYLMASKAGMLSEDGRCKTFDKKANGYVRGEGIAAILLKPLSKAEVDGDHIYGVIKGTAVNHGGHVSSLTVPNPNAQADVIVAAYRRAGIPVENIQYIETHGTGTELGDPVEINGLKKAFNILRDEQRVKKLSNYYCGLGSVKTHIGHLESAAGIAGVIKVLLAMQHKKIPENLHFKELNPYIELVDSPFYIVDKTKVWEPLKDETGLDIPRLAGVSSFGYGGTNAHIVLGEYPNQTVLFSAELKYLYLIALSAKTQLALQQRIKELHDWLMRQTQQPSIEALCYTLNIGRNHFEKRCVFLVKSVEELQETLERVSQGQEVENFIINVNEADKIKNRPALEKVFKLLHAEISAKLPVKEQRDKLLALGNFYVEGYELDWKLLYPSEIKKRISLPTYPFAKDFYWVPSLQSNFPERSRAKNMQKKIVPAEQIHFLSSVQQDFITHVSRLLKIRPDAISLTASLSELGFDSITFKELATCLEKQYGVQLTPAIFFTYTTIETLSQYLLKTHLAEITQSYNQTIDIPVSESDVSISAAALMPSHFEPIAVIGIQGLFPQSKDLSAFWEHLQAGNDLVSEIPINRWNWRENYGDAKKNPDKTNSKWGGFLTEVDTFDAGFFNISTREANLMDPQHRLFLEIVWKTIEDAGYNPISFSGHKVGIFAGVEFSEYQTLIAKEKNELHGYVATGNSHSMLPNRVSYFLNFQGPSEAIDTACSSSLVAIHRAVNAIRNGECSLAVAGGVSLMLNPDTFVITSQLGALSPDGRCKTFDKTANGYVKGEGVAAVLLKPLHQAQIDGDHIYGVIKGTAVNHGGKAQSLTAPNAASQSALLIKAYTEADIDPGTVTYIEVHGTGTELGDPVEIEGLKQAFSVLMPGKNHKKSYCGLSSLKTNIGHLEPASGIAGIIKVLLAMQHEKIPGILHFNELNPYINLTDSPFYIIDKTQIWERLKGEKGGEIPRRAGVSSFGFGGTNAHVVLEEPLSHQPAVREQKPYYLLTISAKQEESLKQKIIDLYEWLKDNFHKANLESLCFTLNVGKAHFDVRCALVVSSLNELLESLQALINGQQPTHCIMTIDKTTGSNGPVLTEIYKSVLEALKGHVDIAPETYREKLLLLADLYIKCYPIDWNLFYTGEIIRRVGSLPAYPFVKQRYWFDAKISPVSVPIIQPTLQSAMPVASTVDLQEFTQHYLKTIFSEKLHMPLENIAVDVTYEVYGVDSVLGLEITERLEQDFGTLPKTLLYERSQLKELATYFQQKFNPVLKNLALKATANNNNVGMMYSDNKIAAPSNFVSEKEVINSNYHLEEIAIIGLSGIYPMAKDIFELWDNLEKGRDCITEVPIERWNYKDYPVMVGGKEKYYQYGGFIPDVDKFDPLFFGIAPRDAALMDPQERLFMQSAWATLEDAGYTRESLQQTVNNNVGVFAGVTYNFYPLFIAEEWFKGNRIPLDIQLFSDGESCFLFS